MASRSLIVEIVGDASSLEREFKRATQAAGKFSGTVKEQAAGAITAQVGQQRELQKLAAEYRLVARNAKQGSEVQITAARLAANAERQLAGSFGVVNAETRRSAGGFTVLHGEVGKASRGALAGSGVFRSLGRSIAFASGGFLAFATAGQFLRTSIDAAKENQVAQKQLGAQFRASGTDLSVYQAAIDRTTGRLSLLAGFTNTELKAGFTAIFRTSNNVSKSLRDLSTAADLARAKHISLAQASLIIAKTEAGNTTLLRRQGFEIRKNATAEEALAVVRAKVAGQGRAGTTAQERFGAVLHNTEEIIGTALLPTLNKYLTSGAKWLTQMNNSGKLQRDVHQTTHALAGAISAISTVVHSAAGAFNLFSSAVGGTKKALELLGAAFIVLKAKAAVLNSGGLATGFRGVGTEAERSSRKVGLLGAALSDLPTTIAITLAVTELITQKQKDKAIGQVNKTLGGFAFGPGEHARDGEVRNLGGQKYVVKTISGQQYLVPLPQKNPLRGTHITPFPPAAPNIPKSVSGGVNTGLTPAQRQQIALAQNPDDLKALRSQAAFDQKQIDRLHKRFADHKTGGKSYTKAITSFLTDQAQTNSHINSLVKTAADAAKTKAKERADRLSQLFDSSISGALNRVQDLAPRQQIAALQTIGGRISQRIAATKDVLKRRTLEDQLLGVVRQQKDARKQLAQDFLDAFQPRLAKAGLTPQLGDDLKVLQGLNAAIKKQIKTTGETPALLGQLYQNESDIRSKREEISQLRSERVQFRVDKAAATAGFADDLKALASQKALILKEIKATGDSLDLERQLFQANQSLTAARLASRNAKQFEALGLTATGEDRVPGVTALKKRLGSITDLVTGTFLDTKKTHSVLAGVARVLKGGLGTVSREMKQTIDGIFKDLDERLKSHQGDVTKFQHTSATNIVKGLGLSREQMRALKYRLADVGPGGTVPSRSPQFALAGGVTAATAPKAASAPVKAPATVKPAAKPVAASAKPAVKPVAVKRIVKPVAVTVRPTAVIRKPTAATTSVIHRIERPRAAPASPIARVPRIRHPVPPAATQHERQAVPATGGNHYHIDNLHINRPIGNPRDLEDQLEKRTRSRAHTRRGT